VASSSGQSVSKADVHAADRSAASWDLTDELPYEYK
jgi:hypothetical protein